MRLHFAEVGDVADVVAFPVLLRVGIVHRFTGDAGYAVEGLQDGSGVVPSATNVVHLAAARRLKEFLDETSHVKGVNIVPDLLAFIAKHRVFPSGNVDANEVTQEAVQFNPRMVRPRQAAAAQRTSRHVEIAAIFLNHYVRRYLGSPKKRVLGLVDGKRFFDAVVIGFVAVLPASISLDQVEAVGGVTIDLISTHVGEGRRWAKLTGGFQQVQRTDGIDVEIIEWARSGQVMAGLGGRVCDVGWAKLLEEFQYPRPVTDIQFNVLEIFALRQQLSLVPTGIPLGAEKVGPHVIVNTVDLPAQCVKMTDDFGADETGRTCYK